MTIREDKTEARIRIIEAHVAAPASELFDIELEKTAISARRSPSRLTIA